MKAETKTKYTVLGITFGPVFALVVTMMILSACKEDKKEERKERELPTKAEHFEYDGHQYIWFSGQWRDESAAVHDPDCKCGENTQ